MFILNSQVRSLDPLPTDYARYHGGILCGHMRHAEVRYYCYCFYMNSSIASRIMKESKLDSGLQFLTYMALFYVYSNFT